MAYHNSTYIFTFEKVLKVSGKKDISFHKLEILRLCE